MDIEVSQISEVLVNVGKLVYIFLKFFIIIILIIHYKKLAKWIKPAIEGHNNRLDIKELVTFSLLLITIYMIVQTSINNQNVFPDIVWITIVGGLLTSVGIKVYKETNTPKRKKTDDEPPLNDEPPFTEE